MDDKILLGRLENLLASVAGNQMFYEQAKVIDNPETKRAFMVKFEAVQQDNAEKARELLEEVFRRNNETRIEKVIRWLKTH